MRGFLWFCGVLSSLFCFFSGGAMVQIRSVSGESIAEAFYQGIGWFVIGLGFFIGPLLGGIAELIAKRNE